MKNAALLALLFCFPATAQQLPTIDLPVVPAPAQQIFLSPSGDDSQAGTAAAPKKTFTAALQAIAFGTPGIDGGNRYAEVVLLEGDYYPGAGGSFVQNLDQWRKPDGAGGWLYKNVGLRGLGKVTIHGDNLPAATQTVFLMGNGIRVSNLRIVGVPLHGVYVLGSALHPHHDLRIDSVEVDGSQGFGIFAQGYTRVLAEHNLVTRSCLSNENGSTCQWPSGLRTDYCSHITMRHNRVFKNWGEGINTSLSSYVRVTDNVVYDNYSVNIYCHSASNAVYANNLIYNQDSLFWRYCYNAGGTAAQGIACANELTCTNACFLFNNGCGVNYHCCAEPDADNAFPQQVIYRQTDSIFIFNNILLNAGIDAWDAFSTLFNFAWLSHFYIAHNTLVGVSGNPQKTRSNLGVHLGTPFYYLDDAHFNANIAALDLSAPNNRPLDFYAVANACNAGGGAPRLFFADNDWIEKPAVAGLNFPTDRSNPELPVAVSPTDLGPLTPGPLNPQLIRKTDKAPWLSDDFFHRPRAAQTNIGAVEELPVSATGQAAARPLLIYPNPVSERLFFSENLVRSRVRISDAAGRVLWEQDDFSGSEISVEGLPNGVYYLWIQGKPACKLVVLK